LTHLLALRLCLVHDLAMLLIVTLSEQRFTLRLVCRGGPPYVTVVGPRDIETLL
jgi:hypothetical protein